MKIDNKKAMQKRIRSSKHKLRMSSNQIINNSQIIKEFINLQRINHSVRQTSGIMFATVVMTAEIELSCYN